MKCIKKSLIMILPAFSALLFSCGSSKVEKTETPKEKFEETEEIIEEKVEKSATEEIIEEKIEESAIEEKKPILKKIDMTKWRHMEEDDVFFQFGIEYCQETEQAPYRKIAVFVPGSLFKAEKNSADFYTAAVRNEDDVPFVMEIDNAKLKAMKASTTYEQKSRAFTKAGMVYVRAGGESAADFKAAARFLRYNADLLPGTTDNLYIYGSGFGGATATSLGFSGDEKENAELKKIGAADYSDKAKGIAAWSPELWGGVESEAESADKETIQESLDDFFAAVAFPHKAPFSSDRLPAPEKPGTYKAEKGMLEGKIVRKPRRGIPNPNEEAEYNEKVAKRERKLKGIFDTAEDYTAALNHLSRKGGGAAWLEYDSESGKAKVTDEHGLKAAVGSGAENTGERPAETRSTKPTEPTADFFRFRVGLFNSGYPIAKILTLKRELEEAGAEVDFKAVWESAETEAELSGSPEDNLIEWIRGIEK